MAGRKGSKGKRIMMLEDIKDGKAYNTLKEKAWTKRNGKNMS